VGVPGRPTGNVELFDSSYQRLGETYFNGDIGIFSLQQLGYNVASGAINIYIKPRFVSPIAATKTQVDQSGKPDNRISASIELNGLVVKDEVKVMLVREYYQGRQISDFYIQVNNLPDLRSAGAAQAIYETGSGSDSGKNFALKRLSRSDVEKILDSDPMSSLSPAQRIVARATILSYLFDYRPSPFPGRPPGFQAGLYRDYVSGGYRLSFRGTDMGKWDGVDDFIDNIRQGLSGNAPQYEAGTLLSWAISKLDTVNGLGFELTGHSLGGGIASAAAIGNHIRAIVFNTAGVNRASLFQSDGVTPIVPGTNPNLADAASWVADYVTADEADTHLQQVDVPDILTWVSRNLGILPDPVGNLLPQEGLLNMTDDESIKLAAFAAFLRTLPSNFNSLVGELYSLAPYKFLWHLNANRATILKMVDSHAMKHIFFGMLHNDADRWNAYSDEDPRGR